MFSKDLEEQQKAIVKLNVKLSQRCSLTDLKGCVDDLRASITMAECIILVKHNPFKFKAAEEMSRIIEDGFEVTVDQSAFIQKVVEVDKPVNLAEVQSVASVAGQHSHPTSKSSSPDGDIDSSIQTIFKAPNYPATSEAGHSPPTRDRYIPRPRKIDFNSSDHLPARETYYPGVTSQKCNQYPSKPDSPPTKRKERKEIVKRTTSKFVDFNAIITHFEGFEKFYVQRVDSIVELDEMEVAMQQFYKDTANQHAVVRPYIGFYAAVIENGVWHRCVITQQMDDDLNVKVFLIDFGQALTVSSSNLMNLSFKFFGVKQAAIKCCLADIAPKPEYNYKYPEKAMKAFKKMAIDKEFIMRITPVRDVKHDEAAAVVVSVFPGNRKKINLNAMIVNLNCARSTGDDSRKMVSKDNELEYSPKKRSPQIDEDSKSDGRKKRFEIEIIRIVNPGEFYAKVKCDKKGECNIVVQLHPNNCFAFQNSSFSRLSKQHRINSWKQIMKRTGQSAICAWREPKSRTS